MDDCQKIKNKNVLENIFFRVRVFVGSSCHQRFVLSESLLFFNFHHDKIKYSTEKKMAIRVFEKVGCHSNKTAAFSLKFRQLYLFTLNGYVMIRKILYSALIAFALHNVGYAQTTAEISSMHVSDSCASLNQNQSPVIATLAVSNYTSGLSVNLFWGDGDSTINAAGNNGYYFEPHVYSLPGVYTVAAVLMDGTNPIDTSMKTIKAFCSLIYGIGYKRMDNNCDQNTNEYIVTAPFELLLKKAGTPVDTFLTNGYINYHSFAADYSSEFSLSVLAPPTGMTVACPSTPFLFMFDTLAYLNGSPFQFAFDCDPNFTGTNLYAGGFGFFRPVSNSYINIRSGNDACMPAAGTITLKISPKYSYVSALPQPTSVSGNTVTWDFTNLSNTNPLYSSVILNPVGTLNLGDTVMNKITITPLTGDVDTTNNTVIMIDTIKSSWDPNNKRVTPEGAIQPGTKLTYNINFENTGNDTAFNIHILDTLSQYLNLKTLKVLASSHAMNYQVFHTDGGEVLRFDFADIHLPDGTGGADNTGFVTYQVETKSGLAPGTLIQNQAGIYFDINPPVITNKTTNIIPVPEGINPLTHNRFVNVYPNPVSDKLFIENINELKQIEITNALGQVVMRQKVTSGLHFLSVKSLPSGLYFLKATNDNGSYSQKFIKK